MTDSTSRPALIRERLEAERVRLEEWHGMVPPVPARVWFADLAWACDEIDSLRARVEALSELLELQAANTERWRDEEMERIQHRLDQERAAGIGPPNVVNWSHHSMLVGHLIAMRHCARMSRDPEGVTRTLAALRSVVEGA